MTTAKWIVEKGSFEAPEYLAYADDDMNPGWIWSECDSMAQEFDDEAAAQAAAVETGVDALRITEKDG